MTQQTRQTWPFYIIQDAHIQTIKSAINLASPTQSDTIRHNHHTYTYMNALSLARLRHFYQTSSLKYVHGVHVQSVHFTAAPRTAALSHTKLKSAETSLNICVVQNGGRRNALYRKRYGMLTLDITVRRFSREQNSSLSNSVVLKGCGCVHRTVRCWRCVGI